jgi:hypothetical protein
LGDFLKSTGEPVRSPPKRISYIINYSYLQKIVKEEIACFNLVERLDDRHPQGRFMNRPYTRHARWLFHSYQNVGISWALAAQCRGRIIHSAAGIARDTKEGEVRE